MSDSLVLQGWSGIAVRIDDELARQRKLQAEGRFEFTAGDYQITHEQRLAILVEEVGEVAKAINERDQGIAAELVQCAAVCVAWLRLLESQGVAP